MYQSIINSLRPKMQEVIVKLQEEFKKIRTGRANPAVIEDLLIDYYGVKSPLKQMASITAPDASSLLINPWDQNSLGDIELALRNSALGFNPVNDGHSIRLASPPLTEERRLEMIKFVEKIAEEAKVSLRQLRQEVWGEIKILEKNKKITEDDRYMAEDQLNKLIEDFNNKILELLEKKREDLKKI